MNNFDIRLFILQSSRQIVQSFDCSICVLSLRLMLHYNSENVLHNFRIVQIPRFLGTNLVKRHTQQGFN